MTHMRISTVTSRAHLTNPDLCITSGTHFFDHSSTWLKKAGGCYETSALSSHFSKNLGIFEHLEVVLVNIQDQCFTYSHALKN